MDKEWEKVIQEKDPQIAHKLLDQMVQSLKEEKETKAFLSSFTSDIQMKKLL